MTSIIYDSAVNDTVVNNINYGSDTFYAMLVTSSYTPSKTTHTKRSDVTNESSGTGYTTGGAATAATVVNDTANNKVTVSFASVSWTTATLTAAAAVIYKRRGGASNADNLVAYVDFGGTVISTAGTFTATFSTPLTFQN